ncbi:hypothetical protein B0H16DRAFT_1459504 [Mycena metata]|uniref:Uncharacterized protein n=1 Tax=Mycena metata TaxID=1033252 RepID=A0AAD7IYM0_9AGAR|nr:hypothetical protein B0H16DRAFT_1459504 [Mycena metata]
MNLRDKLVIRATIPRAKSVRGLKLQRKAWWVASFEFSCLNSAEVDPKVALWQGIEPISILNTILPGITRMATTMVYDGFCAVCWSESVEGTTTGAPSMDLRDPWVAISLDGEWTAGNARGIAWHVAIPARLSCMPPRPDDSDLHPPKTQSTTYIPTPFVATVEEAES